MGTVGGILRAPIPHNLEETYEVNTHHMIMEQIQRMRDKQVEPEGVIVSDDIYMELGSPWRISGVPVDCYIGSMNGFEVR